MKETRLILGRTRSPMSARHARHYKQETHSESKWLVNAVIGNLKIGLKPLCTLIRLIGGTEKVECGSKFVSAVNCGRN